MTQIPVPKSENGAHTQGLSAELELQKIDSLEIYST